MNHSNRNEEDEADESAALEEGEEERKIKVKKDNKYDKQSLSGEWRHRRERMIESKVVNRR